MATSLFFDIFGRDKGVGKTLDDIAAKAEGTGSKVSGAFSKMGAPAAGVLAGLAGLGVKFGGMAAEAEQSTGAVESVFGSAASKVEEFASRSAGAVGLSSQQYNQLSAVTGSALQEAGVAVDELAGKNDELITRGADLASVFGGTTADAVGAMGAAFRGEFDSLEKYGVTLDMNAINAGLAATGQDKLGGAAGEAAKKQEILRQIMEKSAGAAGNFAKESDTATGAQERANASFENAGAKLGEVLLPAMGFVADAAAEMARWAEENSGLVQVLAGVIAGLAGAIVVMNIALGISAIIAAPYAALIGGIIIAMGLLAGAFVWAYENVGWFRDGVDAAFSGIKTAIGAVVDWFTGTVGPAFDTALNGIKGFFEDTVKNVGRIWSGIKELAAAPIRFIVNTVINDGIVSGFNGFSKGLFGDGGPRLSPIRLGFADGGYTGEGGKYEPKGVVHGGEYVFTKEETQKAGVQTLQRLSRVLRGFAEGGFVNPVDGGGTVTQGFSGLNGHNGVDIAGPLNTRIMAAFDGNVTSAGWSSMGGGNEVHIKHAGGWETWYAHLNKLLVRVGQTVNRAATIGLMGSTGNSTGSHLHYMVMNGGWPNVVDPSPFMGGKAPAGGIAFNPLAALFDSLAGGFRAAFPAAGIIGDVGLGVGRKLVGSAGDFLMGGGKGSTRGGLGLDVFDSGGWLDTVGVNRSGKPEAVLTGGQWDTLKANINRPVTVDLSGYTLRLNADATMATFERIAGRAADEAVQAANDDLARGRAR